MREMLSRTILMMSAVIAWSAVGTGQTLTRATAEIVVEPGLGGSVDYAADELGREGLRPSARGAS